MTPKQREFAKDLINNMATYSNAEACYFDQSGYDFVDSKLDTKTHLSPMEYNELVTEIFE